MKRLFILSVALALMLGCATAKINQNPTGKLTTLPFESTIDPNLFYSYNVSREPQPIIDKDGNYGIAYFLQNPDPNGQPQEVVIIISRDEVLLGYGYEINGRTFLFELNETKTRYIKYVPENSGDKSGGM